jgi:renalase
MAKIGIIGAGISGLSCARALQSQACAVTVFEKSRSYGGRCATRLWNGHVVDHGAQFFTVTDAQFRSELNHRVGDSLQRLDLPVLDGSGKPIAATGDGRYYHTKGNNRLGRAMAEGLDVKFECAIAEIEVAEDKVLAGGDSFDAVVCSIPTPQTANLLGWQDSPVSYAPCLTVFFEYAGTGIGLSKEIYAFSDVGGEEALLWSSCENHKQGRIQGDVTVLVVHASEAFSREHLETEASVTVPLLRDIVEKKWDLKGATLRSTFSHRWRYARPVEKKHFPQVSSRLFLCGDGLAKARVEDVWLSGLKTARDIISFLGAPR